MTDRYEIHGNAVLRTDVGGGRTIIDLDRDAVANELNSLALEIERLADDFNYAHEGKRKLEKELADARAENNRLELKLAGKGEDEITLRQQHKEQLAGRDKALAKANEENERLDKAAKLKTNCSCAPLPEPVDDNCPVHGEDNHIYVSGLLKQLKALNAFVAAYKAGIRPLFDTHDGMDIGIFFDSETSYKLNAMASELAPHQELETDREPSPK